MNAKKYLSLITTAALLIPQATIAAPIEIESNTQSVTSGTKNGINGVTSSAGDRNTYDFGIDWSRMPRLSYNQMPSNLWNYMPKQSMDYISGMHCGTAMYDSRTKKTTSVIKCKGHTPTSSCPSDFLKFQFTTEYSYREGSGRNSVMRNGTRRYGYCVKR